MATFCNGCERISFILAGSGNRKIRKAKAGQVLAKTCQPSRARASPTINGNKVAVSDQTRPREWQSSRAIRERTTIPQPIQDDDNFAGVGQLFQRIARAIGMTR